LITHGHYFGAAWSEMAQLCAGINNPAMQISNPNNLSLEEVVQFNFPLNQLTSTGFGQAGQLTNYVRWCMAQVNSGKTDLIQKDVTTLVHNYLDGKGSWFFKLFSPILRKILVSMAMDEINGVENPTTMDAYFAANKDRIQKFLGSTIQEMRNLPLVNTSKIDQLVFGHTHLPIPAMSATMLRTPFGNISASNTGGWIQGELGAEVHIYETGRPLRSVTVK